MVLSVPSQKLRENLSEWTAVLPDDAILVSLMKGVELDTTKRMSEVIAEVTGAGPERIAVVSGPNLAREIAHREPAASVIACADESVAQRLQDLCHSQAFRPYRSTDVLGCELGGAYKNVVALCVGMAIGLGFGDNTTASIITRGLAETARLAMKLGADPMTLMGLAGLGDLVATCSSPLSRNRTFGEKLGQGMTTDEIVASTRQVAEGAKSCAAIFDLADQQRCRCTGRPARRRGGRGRDECPGHDVRVHRPRHQARARLSDVRDRTALHPLISPAGRAPR